MTADETLRKAIDESIGPLITDHHTYLANADPTGLAVARAELHYVFDQYGTELLDFSNPTQPVGHLHPFVTEAIREHLRYYIHTAPSGAHVQRWPVEYARILVGSFTPEGEASDHQVLFTEGEREAKMVAYRIAQEALPGGGRNVRLIHKWGTVVDPIAVRAKIDRVRKDDCAVIVDESLSGFGRFGTMWGQQAYDFEADITVLGGPVGGGLTLGAVVARRGWFDTYTGLTSPQAGSPVSCAAGANTLRALNPGVVEHAADAGDVMGGSLQEVVDQFPGYVVATHGRGLWRALEFQSVGYAIEFVAAARRRGLLVAPPPPGESTIILTPTLIASDQEIARGVDLIADVLTQWEIDDQ